MSSIQKLTFAVTILILASLACSGATSTPAPPPTEAAPASAPPLATPTHAPEPHAPTSTPRPTPTHTPTPSPTATSLPAGVLLIEDFSSQEAAEDKGWVFGSSENVDRSWSPSGLTISIKDAGWLGLNWPDGEYDDFGVEVEARATSDSAEYGLIFRISGDAETRNYYIFGLNTDGRYYLDKLIEGGWSEAAPLMPTQSQYIKPGTAKNRLGVVAQGSRLSLYINGFLIKTVTDDSIPSGEIGVFAATGDADLAEVNFSRFTILTPEKAIAEWGDTPAADSGDSGSAQPAPTSTPGGASTGTGSGNGLMVVSNSFPGACQVNVWGQQEATIRAEGNSSASQSLPPGYYGAHVAADVGEADLSYQIHLPPGGRCTIVCDASNKSVYVYPSTCRQ